MNEWINNEWGSEQNWNEFSSKMPVGLKLPVFNTKVFFLNEERQDASPLGLFFSRLIILPNFKALLLSNYGHSQIPLLFLLFSWQSLRSPHLSHVIHFGNSSLILNLYAISTLFGSSCVLLTVWLIRSPKCFLPSFWNVYSTSYSMVFTFPTMDGEVLYCVLYCIVLYLSSLESILFSTSPLWQSC